MRYTLIGQRIEQGFPADLPSLAKPRHDSLERAILRKALAWGEDAPDTRGSRCPELDARDAAEAHQGPREREDDATPNSRPTALAAMGIGTPGMTPEEAEADRALQAYEQEREDEDGYARG